MVIYPRFSCSEGRHIRVYYIVIKTFRGWGGGGGGKWGLRPRRDAVIKGMCGKLLPLEILKMYGELANHMTQNISHKAGSI